MKKLLLIALLFSTAIGLKAQKPDLPDDFLPWSFMRKDESWSGKKCLKTLWQCSSQTL